MAPHKNRQYEQDVANMTEEIDELGPVDWIVVEFPGSKFNGEIAPALVTSSNAE